MQFDFAAFDRKPSLGERMQQKGGWVFVPGVIGAGIMLLILFILCVVANWFAVITPAVVLVVLAGSLYAQYREIGRTIQLQEFALGNGFSYVHNAPFDFRSGVIFGEGHSQKFTDMLRAHGGNFSEIGNYQYITGSGKNQQVHRYGFIRLKLPRKLPNMVLDSKGNNTFGRFSNLPESFSRGQKLSLEGDFDQYFTLYAPAEYKTDALYIFTPDVMQALIDTAGNYDCEVIDDDFYIYTQPQFVITNRDSFERIMQIVNTLKPELTHESKYYADENVGDRAANIVAPGGARLKTHISALSSIVVVVIALIYIVSFFAPSFMSLGHH